MRELSREERLINARKKITDASSNVNTENTPITAVINHYGADPQDSGAHYRFIPTTQSSSIVQQFVQPSPSCAFSPPPPTSVEYMPNGLQEYANNGQYSAPSGDAYGLGVSQTSAYGVYSDTASANSPQNCHVGMPTGATEVAAQISQQIKHLVSRSSPPQPDLSGAAAMSTNSADQITLNTSQPNHIVSNASPSALSYQSLPAVLSSGAAAGYSRHSSVSDRSTYPSSVGQFASGSANPILIRELQQRNVDLATLLEQRNQTHDRAVAQVATLREQLQRERLSADEKRASLEAATQRELVKARDQVRAHAQTVGALVAEKTELQAKLAHTERLAEQRLKELDETNAKLRETKQRVQTVEEEARLASSNSQNVDIAKQKALRQLERCRENLEREKEARTSLQSELRETEARLFARELDCSKLSLSVEDLKRQLEVAVAFSNNRSQASSNPPSSLNCARCEALKERIHDLESGSTHWTAERQRLESHYKACVAELEKQNGDLQFRLRTVTDSKSEIQKTLEELRRQMTEKEAQLTDVVSELERLKIVNVQQQQQQVLSNSATDTESQQSAAAAVVPSAEEEEEKQRLDEEAIVNSELYQKLQALCTSLQREALEAGQKVTEAEERLAEVESRLQDQAQVLATANSERAALSRAVDQNRKIKEHLTALQNALDIVSAEKDEISQELTKLRGLNAEQSEAVRAAEDSLAVANAKCVELETEVARLRETAQPAQPPELPKPPTPSSLSDRQDAVVSVVADCQTSETQTSDGSCALVTTTITTQTEGKPPEVSVAALQNELTESQAVDCKTSETQTLDGSCALVTTTITTQTESSFSKPEVSVDALQNELAESQAAYTQLEARFLVISERLSRSDEKNSRLEATVAQLEMESSTIGEYITLFAHRRMLAAKRARLREALLARLVCDRRALRKRLSTLMASAAAGEVTQDVTATPTDDEHGHGHSHDAAAADNHCESTVPASDALQKFREELSNFLADLDSAEPVDQTGVDDEEDALADEESAPDAQMDEAAEADELSHRSPVLARRARTESSAISGGPFNLEDQLRLLAVHDCPHCECCSGSLLVV